MNTIKKVLKREKGFTLIELLIVIAIIAVLAILIIPRVTTSLDDANKSTDAGNLKLVQSAVERYYFDKKEYPLTTATLTVGTPVDENGDVDMAKLVDGKYIDKAPTGKTFTLVDGVVK